MRIVVRQCSDPRHHGIHVQTGRSIYTVEEGREISFLCGGDSIGDRRIRQADSLVELVEELRNA